jgi:hypothetical protein
VIQRFTQAIVFAQKFAEGISARESGGEAASAEAKNAAESRLSRLRLTKPRRGIKADAALLIKGVNRWRTD